jgi:hypothetical protein
MTDDTWKEPVLSEADHEALNRAVEMMRNDPDPRRRTQIAEMLREDPWSEAAIFAAYHCQCERLKLKPFEPAPVDVDPSDVDRILRIGRSHQGYQAARLVRQLLDAGLSRYEPDPAKVIEGEAS